MGVTRYLGTRIELVSMDPHFNNIAIALYREDQDGRPEYRVHTYSRINGAPERIQSLRQAMMALGELGQAGDQLYVPCASAHQAAVRRIFLEAAKLPPGGPVVPKPLTVLDKKSGRNITVVSLGGGRYQINADGPEDGKAARVTSIVAGLAKLAEVRVAEESPDQLVFACQQSHDALVGLLLPRALNVRASLREEEAAGGRGMLVAPSQQK
jgi:hypothetical protein